MDTSFSEFDIIISNLKSTSEEMNSNCCNTPVKKDKKIKREPNKLVIINEEELIHQVEIRPILYDKSLKSYRKSALRNQSWKEIADNVNSTVEECRKRWRSLRDAFSKHFKIIGKLDDENESTYFKRKKWIFYDQMRFLAPYLEYAANRYEIEDTNISDYQEDDNSHDSIIDNDEHIEETPFNVKATLNVCESHSNLKQDETELDIDDNNHFITEIFSTSPSQEFHHTMDDAKKINNETSEILSQDTQIISTEEYSAVAAATTTFDSDEKFLLSCSPSLKRLSRKKNALARLKIQQILYDIEFGDD